MSRIGLQPVKIVDGVTVSIEDGGKFGYKLVRVTGPKGELVQDIRNVVDLKVEDNKVVVERKGKTDVNKAFHGLYRSLINNMIIGVTEGYSKELEIVGIGYRAEEAGTKVIFSLGYSHKIEHIAPENITITVTDQTKIKIEGPDKQMVGQEAAKIRGYRPPEPYKGKGVKYADEIVKRKSAKSASA